MGGSCASPLQLPIPSPPRPRSLELGGVFPGCCRAFGIARTQSQRGAGAAVATAGAQRTNPSPTHSRAARQPPRGGKKGPCSSPFAPRIQYNLCLFPFFPVCTFPIAAGGCPRNAERSPWQPPELPNNSPMSARIATAGTAAPRAHASGSTFPKNLRSTPSSKAPVGNRRAGGTRRDLGRGVLGWENPPKCKSSRCCPRREGTGSARVLRVPRAVPRPRPRRRCPGLGLPRGWPGFSPPF